MDLRKYFTKLKTSGRGPTIRSAFRKRLLLLVTCAFAVTFSIAYYMQTLQAEERARAYLAGQLNFVCDRVHDAKKNRIYLENKLSDDMVSDAKGLARILAAQPALLTNKAFVREICRDYGVDELNITDASGMTISGYPEFYIGLFNFAAYPETQKYMAMIKDKDLIISEPLRLSAYSHGSYVKYVGVARLDEPGIIQIGMSGAAYAKYMSAASLSNLVADYVIGETGAVYILDKAGIVEGATDTQRIGYNMDQLGISKEKFAAFNGFFQATPAQGQSSLCAYDRHDDYLLLVTYPESEVYAKRNDLLVWNGALYFMLFTAVYVLISMLLESSIVKNIFTVNKALDDITQGNLEEKVNVRAYQEFDMLSDSINTTVDALKAAIAEAAARLDRELEIARIIQSSSLPNKFPPWPEIKDFSIFANMQMATQVGGDFYDFFLIDQKKLGFVIADVSGHGIPAALFMMTARTQIKNHLLENGDLGEEFTRINDLLCSNNKAMMFVTVFAGVLDYTTGLVTCVNAGHNKPLVGQQGSYAWVKQRSGLVMGGMANLRYKPFTVQLQEGDIFFLYTDGITEAVNTADEQFGDERLQAVLNQAGTSEVTALAGKVKAAVKDFTQGMEQDDDQTLLALKWH